MRYVAVLSLLLAALVPSPGTAAASTSTDRADLLDAARVLHTWDERRAAAWAESDPVALRGLYVPGSVAGAADVRLLQAYRRHGVVVRRLVTQVFALRVVRHDESRLVLEVSDRIAGGAVLRGGRPAQLPSTPPARRVVELRQEAGGWRVAAVSDSGRALRAAPR